MIHAKTRADRENIIFVVLLRKKIDAEEQKEWQVLRQIEVYRAFKETACRRNEEKMRSRPSRVMVAMKLCLFAMSLRLRSYQ